MFRITFYIYLPSLSSVAAIEVEIFISRNKKNWMVPFTQADKNCVKIAGNNNKLTNLNYLKMVSSNCYREGVIQQKNECNLFYH